jgi:hypothetical protein
VRIQTPAPCSHKKRNISYINNGPADHRTSPIREEKPHTINRLHQIIEAA